MPITQCKTCAKKFYAKPSWLKKGHGKFCSRSCYFESHRTGKVIKCSTCNKSTYKSSKALRGSKSKKYFCSKSCQTVWRNSVAYTGSNHPNWKKGRYTYRRVIEKSNKSKVCVLCESEDKRVLAVHHVDENHLNNSLENLIWLCQNCHFLVHNYDHEKSKLMTRLQ